MEEAYLMEHATLSQTPVVSPPDGPPAGPTTSSWYVLRNPEGGFLMWPSIAASLTTPNLKDALSFDTLEELTGWAGTRDEGTRERLADEGWLARKVTAAESAVAP